MLSSPPFYSPGGLRPAPPMMGTPPHAALPGSPFRPMAPGHGTPPLMANMAFFVVDVTEGAEVKRRIFHVDWDKQRFRLLKWGRNNLFAKAEVKVSDFYGASPTAPGEVTLFMNSGASLAMRLVLRHEYEAIVVLLQKVAVYRARAQSTPYLPHAALGMWRGLQMAATRPASQAGLVKEASFWGSHHELRLAHPWLVVVDHRVLSNSDLLVQHLFDQIEL